MLVATDLQYAISDAARIYPKNVKWHIYWVLAGNPEITPGSIRVPLDPRNTVMQPGWTYEFL